MTEFYGLPNSAHFWHWPTLFHFAFVALAGGAATVTAVAAWTNHPKLRLYALITMIFIVLDLITLWAESPARFRFTHVWLFLAFTPTAPIWVGAWGLIISIGSSFFLWIAKGPKLLWTLGITVGAALAMFYPGWALAININRPLWTPLLILLFPLTGMTTVVALAALFRQGWATRYLAPLSLASLAVAALYLFALATGSAEARHAFEVFWHHDALWLVGALVLLAATPALVRRVPLAAAVLPLVGATVVRSLIVEAGQAQFFGF
jgi:hypothetical protein